MLLPSANKAIVTAEKLTDYLLSPDHPVGIFKAQWFRSLAYTRDTAAILERDLKNIARFDARRIATSEFGRKYKITATITSPTDKNGTITTIWIVKSDESIPRFVTAYPEG